METASLLREYDMVIGTVTVPEDGCNGLLQEFDELVGDAVEDDCSGGSSRSSMN